MNYMSIDHHKQYSYITLMDENLEVPRAGKIDNLRNEVERLSCLFAHLSFFSKRSEDLT